MPVSCCMVIVALNGRFAYPGRLLYPPVRILLTKYYPTKHRSCIISPKLVFCCPKIVFAKFGTKATYQTPFFQLFFLILRHIFKCGQLSIGKCPGRSAGHFLRDKKWYIFKFKLLLKVQACGENPSTRSWTGNLRRFWVAQNVFVLNIIFERLLFTAKSLKSACRLTNVHVQALGSA